MKMDAIRPAGCDSGPNKNCVLDSAAYSKNAPKNQSRTLPPLPPHGSESSVNQWRKSLISDGYFERVEILGADGELGPIGLLVDKGCGPPLICVGFHTLCTVVWICPSRCPRSWSVAPFKVFLLRPGQVASVEAVRYARQLAATLKRAAEAEQARLDRAQTAYLREKFGGGR